MTNSSNSLISRLLDMHKSWDYEVKKLGVITFCSYCKDELGRTYVLYPCETVRLVKESIDDGK